MELDTIQLVFGLLGLVVGCGTLLVVVFRVTDRPLTATLRAGVRDAYVSFEVRPSDPRRPRPMARQRRQPKKP